MSTLFLKAIRDNYLTQFVDMPTRARGSDTPHILDLVISNNPVIHNINYLSPLGLSDHAVLEITCDFGFCDTGKVNKLNYDKGDYDNFRKFIDIDWSPVLIQHSNDMEYQWNCFKEKLLEGEKLFVPQVCHFNSWKNKNWRRPFNLQLRHLISEKKHAWKMFIKCRKPEALYNYKKIRNKVRNETRNVYKSEQRNVANQSKVNPKKFWNYVNSKFKTNNKIGNLRHLNSMGIEEIIYDDITKTDILNQFFLVYL